MQANLSQMTNFSLPGKGAHTRDTHFWKLYHNCLAFLPLTRYNATATNKA